MTSVQNAAGDTVVAADPKAQRCLRASSARHLSAKLLAQSLSSLATYLRLNMGLVIVIRVGFRV